MTALDRSYNLAGMQEYHTIIVGGGPGGLACATLLARAGRKVLVLERRPRIGPKVCAGGVTWSGLRQRLPETLVQKTFPDQHLFTRWQQTVISAAQPLVSTVNREELGQWQLQEALAAGVRVETNRPVGRIGERSLEAGREMFSFRYLVGADGSSSTVRRHLGLLTREVGVGLNLFVEGDFPRMEWHLDDRFFNNGYAWIFPHRGRTSIGAYAGRLTVEPGILRKNFLLWAAGHGIKLGSVKLDAGLINYDFQGWHFGHRFLVGDAAGLASPLTGEGIFPAIVSGEETARTILDPRYPAPEMVRLLARHHLHRRLVAFTGRNRLACRLTMETLVAALRIGAVSFNALEMAG